ncbi:Nitrogen permease regulator 2-like protein [Oopsacas minuta]|uniref:Nitrogen permease regulator 2-like protein n=1 Tax=Oopsacas minuta TaxID=111878 RepID=A0AAV7JJ70_9METZ|nr:Nitrogen permease regulator 2-like protein [Oopsacas minuta]
MTSTNSIIENFPIPSAILFLEFTSLGPTLLHQAPLGYLTDEQISRIQNFVFPPLSLFDRTLTLFHENRKYIGHAKCILGEQYKRNQYSFNCLLCFDGNLDVFPYHAVLTKIANEFSIYEIEEAFFSSPYDSDNFQSILNAILHGLRTVGEVNLEITDCNWLFLKVLPTNTDTLLEPIDSKSVPVIQHNIRTITHTELDLTIAEVLSHMDEIRPLSSIAKDSDVSLKEIGIDVSRHLQYYNILQGFVPIFQYTNAYLISPRIPLLLNSTEFQGEMLTYLRRDFDLQLVCINEVIRLFLSLKHAQSLYQLYRLELNEMLLLGQTALLRRIIEFGIFKKIIIPLKEYLYLSPSVSSRLSGLLERKEDFVQVDTLCWSQGGSHRDFVLQILEENEYTTLYV